MPLSKPADPTTLPARVLAEAVSARRLSPVDLIDATIAKISASDPRLHAFVETYFDDARLAAEGADRAVRSGHAVGPLHGMPVALKDLVELEGRVATGGSKAWRDRRSSRTATLARRLVQAGMIVVGKTHTVEFAFGGWGTNQHMGTPWNPWDPRTHRVPGGSSSGSGVAVAARMVPWAIGTDTGGSVRLPASFCGLTGLKTTIGLSALMACSRLPRRSTRPGRSPAAPRTRRCCTRSSKDPIRSTFAPSGTRRAIRCAP